MSVIISNTFGEGVYTPHCNDCMIALCWDISEEEYLEQKYLWDNWCCPECQHNKTIENGFND